MRASTSSRRWIGLTVVALAGVALLAGAALAAGGSLIDRVLGRPAPSQVVAVFRAHDGPVGDAPAALTERPGLVVSEARGILAADTSAGPVALWLAPTSRDRQTFGRFCWEAGFIDEAGAYLQPLSLAACDPPRAPTFYAFTGSVYRSVTSPGVYEDPGRYLGYTIGHAPVGVASVRLGFTNGEERDVPTFDRFFFGEIPCGWTLDSIVGLDASGAAVADLTHELDGDPSDNIGPAPRCSA